jgi:hypothetical protein
MLKFEVVTSITELESVPLFTVSVRRSVIAPVPLKVLLVAPVKVTFAPAVFALVLKSRTLLFVRFPATERICPVCVPLEADWKVPFVPIITLLPTVSVRAVVASYWRIAGSPPPYRL